MIEFMLNLHYQKLQYPSTFSRAIQDFRILRECYQKL